MLLDITRRPQQMTFLTVLTHGSLHMRNVMAEPWLRSKHS